MKEKIKILVTGGNAPGFPSIVKALRTREDFIVYGCDWKSSIVGSQLTEEYFIIPDNKKHEAYIHGLIQLCAKEGIRVIIPLRTDELAPLCKHLKTFHDINVEVCLPVSSSDLLETVNNKARLFEYMNFILGIKPMNYGSVTNTLKMVLTANSLGYPEKSVCVKPAVSNGSRGFRELIWDYDFRDSFFKDKPNNTKTSLSSLVNDLGFNPIPELLVMENLPGKEYTVDVLCHKGRTFAVIPRLRIKIKDGITVEAQVTDFRLAEIHMICKKLVEGFGFSYCIGVQLKEDRNGNLTVLEINPRLQGTTALSIKAGVNIPVHMVEMALGVFDYDFKPSINWGLRMERRYKEYYADGELRR